MWHTHPIMRDTIVSCQLSNKEEIIFELTQRQHCELLVDTTVGGATLLSL